MLFLDQYDMAGSETFLNTSGYLSDGVHPSVNGISYFAGNVASLLDTAAATAPEPAGMAVVAVLGMALTRRWRPYEFRRE